MRGFALHCNTVTVRWRRARRVQGFARLRVSIARMPPRRRRTKFKRKPPR